MFLITTSLLDPFGSVGNGVRGVGNLTSSDSRIAADGLSRLRISPNTPSTIKNEIFSGRRIEAMLSITTGLLDPLRSIGDAALPSRLGGPDH